MINDLIVMTFDDETDASKARGVLEIMRNRYFLGVVDAIVVTMDSAGGVVVHSQRQLRAQPSDPSSEVSRLLAGAIFVKPPEDGVKELVNAGLDERFVNTVSSALTPETSLLLNYIRKDSLIDTQQFLDALKQFRGTLHHTTVPAEVEEAILNQARCQ
jgi:uncharacterized membrane protein